MDKRWNLLITHCIVILASRFPTRVFTKKNKSLQKVYCPFCIILKNVWKEEFFIWNSESFGTSNLHNEFHFKNSFLKTFLGINKNDGRSSATRFYAEILCRLSQTHEKWSVMTGATISKPFTKLSLPSSSKTNDINVEKFENLNYNSKHLLKW